MLLISCCSIISIIKRWRQAKSKAEVNTENSAANSSKPLELTTFQKAVSPKWWAKALREKLPLKNNLKNIELKDHNVDNNCELEEKMIEFSDLGNQLEVEEEEGVSSSENTENQNNRNTRE
jgi:hypothetical protein